MTRKNLRKKRLAGLLVAFAATLAIATLALGAIAYGWLEYISATS